MKDVLKLMALLVVMASACGDDPVKKQSPPNANANGVTNNATTPNNGTTGNNKTTVEGTCAEFDSELVSFPATRLGETSTAQLQLTNCSVDTPLDPPIINFAKGEEFELTTSLDELEPGGSRTLQFSFTPQQTGTRSDDVRFEWGAVFDISFVELSGRGISDECGDARALVRESNGGSFDTAISTLVGTELELDASDSTPAAGTISRYDWAVISKPAESSAVLSSNTGVAPLFTPDVPGNYRISLDITDSQGNRACEAAEIAITATSDGGGVTENLQIQLVWDTPADDDQTDTFGADLDLHWVHENGTWNDQRWDCHWAARSPDWGPQAGTPVMDIDDSDGAGPENINHDSAGSGVVYSAGVYYYADKEFGASYATIRFWVNDTLVYEYRDRFLTQGQLWHAFDYEVPANVVEIDVVTDDFQG